MNQNEQILPEDETDMNSTTSNNSTTSTDSSSSSSRYQPTYENERITLYDSQQPEPSSEEEPLEKQKKEGKRSGTNHKQRYEFEVMTLVPPPLEYMATLHDEEREISGRQVWCGSFLLCAVLLWKERGGGRKGGDDDNGRQTLVGGKRVLELGSGTGILGMLASKLNPVCVAMTDGDDQAIQLLRQNLSNPTNQIDEQTTKVCPLSWTSAITTTTGGGGNHLDDNGDNDIGEKPHGKEEEEKETKGRESKNEGDEHDTEYCGNDREFCNWCRTSWPDIYDPVVLESDDGIVDGNEQTVKHDVMFDCILAGDVMYKPHLPKAFFRTVLRYLAPTTTTIPHSNNSQKESQQLSSSSSYSYFPPSLYLCHVPRAGISHEIILQEAQDAGLEITEEWTSEDVGEGFDWDMVDAEDLERARVYCMRRRV